MHRSISARPSIPRHVVLGTAVLMAAAVWLAPQLPAAHAEEPKPPAAPAAPAAPAPPPLPALPAAPEAPKAAKAAKAAEKAGAAAADAAAAAGEAGARAAEAATAAVEAAAPKRGKRVHVMGIESDREYDSFSELVHEEPWLGALIFWSVTLVFVTPLLIIVALVWYKMRKNRLLNETMLKLAEKGVVPPGEAMEAIALGKPAAAIGAGASAGALYEQAKQVRRRVAWSDLRKGVVLGGIGAALTLASIVNDGEANGFGLVLLFVGIGYAVLWWFEERQPRATGGASPGGPAAGA
jgi:hypothetical protein